MVATLSLNYGSSSESTEQEITNTLDRDLWARQCVRGRGGRLPGHELLLLLHVQYDPVRRRHRAAQALHNAFRETNAAGQAFYALCAQGDSEACTTFTSNMGQGASAALNSFNGLVADLSTATNPDLSFLQTFPNGVAGAVTPQTVTSPIPATAIPTNEVLAPYKPQLEEFMTLLNQIATLNNRVGLLQGLFSGRAQSQSGAVSRSCGLSEPPGQHL